jgi:hypothetical protein
MPEWMGGLPFYIVIGATPAVFVTFDSWLREEGQPNLGRGAGAKGPG